MLVIRTVEVLCDPNVKTFDSNGDGEIVQGKDFYQLSSAISYEPDIIENPYVHLLGTYKLHVLRIFG